MFSVLLLLLLIGSGLWYVTRPAFLAAQLEKHLRAEMPGIEVTVDAVVIKSLRMIRADGIALRFPEESDPFLSINSVTADLFWDGLAPHATHLSVDGMMLLVAEDRQGRLNLSEISFAENDSQEDFQAPAITLRRGRVLLKVPDQAIYELGVSADVRLDDTMQLAEAELAAITPAGRELSFQGVLQYDHMGIGFFLECPALPADATLLSAVPYAPVREWVARVKPTGELRDIDLFAPLHDPTLIDASMTLHELNLQTTHEGDRWLPEWAEPIFGEASLTLNGSLFSSHERLTGDLNLFLLPDPDFGLPDLSMDVDLSLPLRLDEPWHVGFDSQAFELERDGGWIQGDDLHDLREYWSPAGIFTLSGDFSADEFEAWPSGQITLHVVEASIEMVAELPLPATTDEGMLQYNLPPSSDEPGQLSLIGFKGQSGLSDDIEVEGTLQLPTPDHTPLDLDITLRDMTLDPDDRALLEGLGAEVVLELFAGENSMHQDFAPYAKMSEVHITVLRDSPTAELLHTVRIQNIADSRLLPEPWPFPLHLQSGNLMIDHETAVVTDLHATGPDGFSAHGEADISMNEGGDWQLVLSQIHAQIGGTFLESLPPSLRSELVALSLQTGELSGRGRLAQVEQQDALEWDFDLTYSGPLQAPEVPKLDKVEAELKIDPRLLEIHSLQTRLFDSPVSLQGEINIQEPEHDWDIRIEAPAVELSQAGNWLFHKDGGLLAEHAAAYDALSIAGRGVCALSLNQDGIQRFSLQPEQIQLVWPEGLLEGETLQLHEGELVLSGSRRVDLNQLKVAGTGFAASVEGDVWWRPNVPQDADHVEIDLSTSFEIQELQELSDRMLKRLSGSRYIGGALKGQARISMNQDKSNMVADLDLVDVAMFLGNMRLQNILGNTDISLVQDRQDIEPVRLSATGRFEQARLLGRSLTDLTFAMDNSERPSEIQLRRLNGDFCNGQIYAAGIADVTSSRLSMDVLLSGADTGLLTGSKADGSQLVIGGRLWGDPDALEGELRFDCMGLQLGGSALSSALVELMSFSLPAGARFDAISGRIVLRENRSTALDSLLLTSPVGVSLAGGGTLKKGRLDVILSSQGNLDGTPLEGFRKGLTSLHVTGPLDYPTILPVPLRRLR